MKIMKNDTMKQSHQKVSAIIDVYPLTFFHGFKTTLFKSVRNKKKKQRFLW